MTVFTSAAASEKLGVKIRKKCPQGGAYYSIIQPEKESTPNGVHSTADLVTVSAAEQSTENCDIKTTVEMVVISLITISINGKLYNNQFSSFSQGSLAGMFFNKSNFSQVHVVIDLL